MAPAKFALSRLTDAELKAIAEATYATLPPGTSSDVDRALRRRGAAPAERGGETDCLQRSCVDSPPAFSILLEVGC